MMYCCKRQRRPTQPVPTNHSSHATRNVRSQRGQRMVCGAPLSWARLRQPGHTAYLSPHYWTVVPVPRDARSLPAMWGDKYAVCPGCRNRAQLKGAPHTMRCPRCERTFRVAWEEWFVGAG